MKYSSSLNVSSLSDYNPFGMLTVGRTWVAGSQYRYSFNGKEHDDELIGNDNALDFGARIYDCKIGRFFSRDPRSNEYSWQSVYAYYKNSPILICDINGLGGPESYTVKSGDSPESIANEQGISIWELASSNVGSQEGGGYFEPIGDGSYENYWVVGSGTKWKLNAGDVLIIPGNGEIKKENNSSENNKSVNTPLGINYASIIFGAADDIILPILDKDLAKKALESQALTKMNKNVGMVSENGIKWITENPKELIDKKIIEISTPKWMVYSKPALGVVSVSADAFDIGVSFYNAQNSHDPNDQMYFMVEGYLKMPQLVPGLPGFIYGLSFNPIIRPMWEKGKTTYDYAIDHGADPSVIFIMGGLGYSPRIEF